MLFYCLLFLIGLSWSFTLEGGPIRRERIVPSFPNCGGAGGDYFFEVTDQASNSAGDLYVVYRTNNPSGNSSRLQGPDGTLAGPILIRPPSLTASARSYVILAKFDSVFSLLWQVWIESPGGNKNCGSENSVQSGQLRVDSQGSIWLSASTGTIVYPSFNARVVPWRVANSSGVVFNATAHALLLKFLPTGELAWYDYSTETMIDYATSSVSFAVDEAGNLLATWIFRRVAVQWATYHMNAAGFLCSCPDPGTTSNPPDCTCFVFYAASGVVTWATELRADNGQYVLVKDVHWLGPGNWAVSIYYAPFIGVPWELSNNLTFGGKSVLTAVPADYRTGATVLMISDSALLLCSRTFWSHSCCNSRMFPRGSEVMDGFFYGLYYYSLGYYIDDDINTLFKPAQILSFNMAGDLMLAKLDGSCNVWWHRTNQDGKLQDFGFALAADPRSGYLYVALATDSNLNSGALEFLSGTTQFGVLGNAPSTQTWSLMGNAMTGVVAFRSSDGLMAGSDYMQQTRSPAGAWDAVAKVSSMSVLRDGRLCVGGTSNATLRFRNTSITWALDDLGLRGSPGFFLCYPAAPPQPDITFVPTTRQPTTTFSSSSSSPPASSPVASSPSRAPGPPPSNQFSTPPPSVLVVIEDQQLPYLDLSATTVTISSGVQLQVDLLVAQGPVTITLDVDLASLTDGLELELLSFTTLQGDLSNLNIVLANSLTTDCWVAEASVQEQKVFVIFSIQADSCTGLAPARFLL